MPETVPAAAAATVPAAATAAATGSRPSGRAPRRDAIRNDARVLAAAREVLAESGPQASMEEIAVRAGVGVGTIYRRFASKDALIDALVGLVVDELAEAADRALADSGGTGLQRLLVALGESFAAHRRYAGLMFGRGDERGAERIRGRIEELTRRSVEAGVLSPDTTTGDVMALVWSLRALAEMTSDIAPDAWRRHLDIHLAGLSAPGSLSRVPAMSADQIRRISAVPTADSRAPGPLEA